MEIVLIIVMAVCALALAGIALRLSNRLAQEQATTRELRRLLTQKRNSL